MGINYKRFYSKFKAYTKKGELLSVHRKGNHLIIKNSKQLYKLVYFVKQSQGDKRIWDNIIGCAGTIFSKNSFLLNYQLITGYFEGFKTSPLKVTIHKSKQVYGASSLNKILSIDDKDVFFAKNYSELIDSPLLYAKADTLSFKVADAKFHIAVFSQNKLITSKLLQPTLMQVVTNIYNYYGNLPSKDYHFIFYCIDDLTLNTFESFGIDSALEHLNSSVYFLSEDLKTILPYVNYIAMHEYLHTFAPLTIRSEKISDFNFDNPTMSQHLWFYEGLTDYTAHLILERYKMKSNLGFNEELSGDLSQSIKLKARSLTKSSAEIINKNIFDWYSKILQIMNFYSKGKLVSFGLDMELFELSKGTMRLKDLMLKLQEKYNFNQPFKDDEFLAVLVENSYPEIKTYVDKYIKGKELIPYQKYFTKLGWKYIAKKELVYSFGLQSTSFRYDKKIKKYIIREDIKNVFKIQKGDIIIDVKSDKLTSENMLYIDKVVRLLFPEKNESITVTIKRGEKEYQLYGLANQLRKSKFSYIIKTTPQTKEQISFRKNFLFGE